MLQGRLETLGEHVGAVGSRLDDVDHRLGQLPAADDINGVRKELADLASHSAADLATKLGALHESVSGTLTPIAEELKSRPGHADVEAAVTKIVDAAQADVAGRLGSLEETVLTLAEALLRPANRPTDLPREGNRI
jgi:hypothetical protein